MKKNLLASILAIIFTCVLGMSMVMADGSEEMPINWGYYMVKGSNEITTIPAGANPVEITLEKGETLSVIEFRFNQSTELYKDSVKVKGANAVRYESEKKFISRYQTSFNSSGTYTLTIVPTTANIASYGIGTYKAYIPSGYVIVTDSVTGKEYTNQDITIILNIVAKGTLNNDADTTIDMNLEPLASPKPVLNGSQLSWDKVEGASYYTVEYFKGEQSLKSENGYFEGLQENDAYGSLNYVNNFPIETGYKYSAKVTAYPAKGSNYRPSESSVIAIRDGNTVSKTVEPIGLTWTSNREGKQTVFSYTPEQGKIYFIQFYKNGKRIFFTRGTNSGSMNFSERMKNEGTYWVELWVTDINNLELASNKTISPIVIVSADGSIAVTASDSNITQLNAETGVWIQDNKGWWYSFADNTYPVSRWLRLGEKWYYFGADGYMVTGWQLIDGKWYYLAPINGDMLEGWQQVDGKYYYLMPGSGECLMNTITPDGFTVDESGAWIQ